MLSCQPDRWQLSRFGKWHVGAGHVSSFGPVNHLAPHQSARPPPISSPPAIAMSQSKPSTSKVKIHRGDRKEANEALGIDGTWHKPFVGYLEPFQQEWNDSDQSKKQDFLREKRDGLESWAKGQPVLAFLPENKILKNVCWQIILLVIC